jgi:uncharacterized protein (DUF2147 family)
MFLFSRASTGGQSTRHKGLCQHPHYVFSPQRRVLPTTHYSDDENLGKPIVSHMHSKDGITFSGGTIWDPEHDKTYKSKMTLKGDDLDVEGCVSIVCSGQDWKRFK